MSKQFYISLPDGWHESLQESARKWSAIYNRKITVNELIRMAISEKFMLQGKK